MRNPVGWESLVGLVYGEALLFQNREDNFSSGCFTLYWWGVIFKWDFFNLFTTAKAEELLCYSSGSAWGRMIQREIMD